MSFNNQGAHSTSGVAIDTTPAPNGFVYGDLTSLWTESPEGNYFVLSASGGNAIEELMSDHLYSGNTLSSQANIPVTPVFDYVYSPANNLIAKVISVVDDNTIIIDRTVGGGTDIAIGATTSIIKPPTRIGFSIDTLADFLILSFADGTSYQSPAGTGGIVEKAVWAGFGTLIPFLSVSNTGSNATTALIEY